MSKKQLFKDNLIVFIGGNIANAMTFILTTLLSRTDKGVFNLYFAYTSISIILLVPSIVVMRVFTVFGDSVLEEIKIRYEKNKRKYRLLITAAFLSLLPITFIVTKLTVENSYKNAFLLLTITVIGIFSNIFRGIKQNQENFTNATLSMITEFFCRMFFGFVLAVPLHFGISGILIGHIIGVTLGLVICLYGFKHPERELNKVQELKLKSIFINSFLVSAGLEFFSNFDILYSNHILLNNCSDQNNCSTATEFNTLQFLRKIIFFGSYAVSSIILSIGGKNKHSKKFIFFFILIIGTMIGLGFGSFFFLFKSLIAKILKQDLSLFSTKTQIYFIIFTTLMSTAYLLSNWLFTMKNKSLMFLALIASSIQIVIFVIVGKDFNSLLNAFFISSAIFFAITFIAGLTQIKETEKVSTLENLEEIESIQIV